MKMLVMIEDTRKADGRITMRLSQPEMLFTAQEQGYLSILAMN
jgi:hypothetical protein